MGRRKDRELTRDELEDSLQTREQKFAAARYKRLFVSKMLIKSKAFRSLRTPASYQVYMIFLTKCRWEKKLIRGGSLDKAWYITNNGQITFTYHEASARYGISAKRFTKAIDELIRVGLIDIAVTSLGLHKVRTFYGISDRWELYGTEAFVAKARPKRALTFGFARPQTGSTSLQGRCSTSLEGR
jgi:hypothetical protein